MSVIGVLGFADMEGAAQARAALVRLEQEKAITLLDAVVVVCRPNGRVEIKQQHNTVAQGAIGGTVFGLALGVLLLNPLVGVAVGAASGALLGKVNDLGLDDEFVHEIAEVLHPGTSALCVLVTQVDADRAIERLRPLQPTVIRSSLTPEAEERLRTALAQAQA